VNLISTIASAEATFVLLIQLPELCGVESTSSGSILLGRIDLTSRGVKLIERNLIELRRKDFVKSLNHNLSLFKGTTY
jgi:hypothetical protein